MLNIQKRCEPREKFDAELVLPFELRQKTRLRTQTTSGEETGIFLPRGAVLRDGDFLQAWGGIASLQLGLSVVWTGAAERGIPLERLADWLATRPAALAGLSAKKGAIAVGRDADLVVWDPDAETTVDAKTLHHRHPVTPYDGRRLRGRVLTTILRGIAVFDRGDFTSLPIGTTLRREP